MNWIFDNFQIVILVLLGVGSLVKSLLEAKAKQATEQQAEWNEDSEVPLDEDTSYRKIKSTVPSVQTRPTTPPSLQMAGYDVEVAKETAIALKHQQDLAERLRQIRETKATITGGALATRVRIASRGVAKPLKLTALTLRDRLRDPEEIRQALVMREILDPPVGLR